MVPRSPSRHGSARTLRTLSPSCATSTSRSHRRRTSWSVTRTTTSSGRRAMATRNRSHRPTLRSPRPLSSPKSSGWPTARHRRGRRLETSNESTPIGIRAESSREPWSTTRCRCSTRTPSGHWSTRVPRTTSRSKPSSTSRRVPASACCSAPASTTRRGSLGMPSRLIRLPEAAAICCVLGAMTANTGVRSRGRSSPSRGECLATTPLRFRLSVIV